MFNHFGARSGHHLPGFTGISSPFEAVTQGLSFLTQEATAPSHALLVWLRKPQRECWGTVYNHFGTRSGHAHWELLEFPHRLRQLLEASPSSARRQLPHLIHCWRGNASPRGNGGELCAIILVLGRATTYRQLLEFPHRLRQWQLPHLMRCWSSYGSPRGNVGELCTIILALGRATPIGSYWNFLTV